MTLVNGKINYYLLCFQIVYGAANDHNAFRNLFIHYILSYAETDVAEEISAYNSSSLPEALSRAPVVTFHAIQAILDLGRSEVPPRP